ACSPSSHWLRAPVAAGCSAATATVRLIRDLLSLPGRDYCSTNDHPNGGMVDRRVCVSRALRDRRWVAGVAGRTRETTKQVVDNPRGALTRGLRIRHAGLAPGRVVGRVRAGVRGIRRHFYRHVSWVGRCV
ncbi:unnamed protein product, partial [Ectocarpus sp. 4 AP-2014]